MASGYFDTGRQRFLRGQIDWENNDVRALLVQDTYTFDPTDEFVADLVAHELGATDYARQATTGRSVGVSAPTYLLLDDITWVGLGGAVNQIVGALILFVNTGSDATAPLILCCDNADIQTQDTDLVAVFGTGRVASFGG